MKKFKIKKNFPQRQYKDKLFRAIFNEKKYLIELYNALNKTSYTNPDDFEINTLDDVIYITMKNDLSFMIDSYMTLYEHQSSFNPNMPLRGLIYFSQLYLNYLTEHQHNIHTSKLIKIPTPQFIVFYNGNTELPDVTELKLSSAFEKPLADGKFEWTAKMININKNHNKDLLKNCKPLYDYSRYVGFVKGFLADGKSTEEAVHLAIDKAIKENLLDGYFLKRKREVLKMSLTEFDLESFLKTSKEAGYDEGLEQGREDKELEMCVKLLESGKMSESEITELFNLTEEQIKAIHERMAVPV